MHVYLLLDGCAQLNLVNPIYKALEGLKLKINTLIFRKNLVELTSFLSSN
jgi:hypothetical protein